MGRQGESVPSVREFVTKGDPNCTHCPHPPPPFGAHMHLFPCIFPIPLVQSNPYPWAAQGSSPGQGCRNITLNTAVPWEGPQPQLPLHPAGPCLHQPRFRAPIQDPAQGAPQQRFSALIAVLNGPSLCPGCWDPLSLHHLSTVSFFEVREKRVEAQQLFYTWHAKEAHLASSHLWTSACSAFGNTALCNHTALCSCAIPSCFV